jgi:plasmid stability protein
LTEHSFTIKAGFMKNITVNVDDETYRKARIHAAAAGTSVSAMVREFLSATANSDTGYEDTVRQLRKIYAQADKRATERSEPLIPPSRDELYAGRMH